MCVAGVFGGSYASAQGGAVKPQPQSPPLTVAETVGHGEKLKPTYMMARTPSGEKITPQVWRVVVRQQYTKAITNLVFPAMMLFFTLCYGVVSWKWIGYPDWRECWSDNQMFQFLWSVLIPTAGVIIFGTWLSNEFADSVGFLMNPEYYAMQDGLLNW